MTTKVRKVHRTSDNVLLYAALILVCVGTVMIYSSSVLIAADRFGDEYHFLKKQIVFVVIGLLAMIAASRFPYHFWKRLAYPGIILSCALLVILAVPGAGSTVGGATRWLKVGPFSFQVSEAVKVAVVIFMAHYLTKKADHLKEFFRVFMVPLVLISLIVAFILLQPDFGTAVIITATVLIMFFVAGGRVMHLAGLTATIAPVAVFLLVRESYRVQRIMAFRSPWDDPSEKGYQIIQSFISFGSGGAFGVGLGNSMQKLFYLPEPHTDFILAVLAEEVGFIAVALVILLFAVLVVRGFMIAFRSDTLFGTLLASGLTTLLALQGFLNMAVVMGLLPTKGLALPFMSYGGTSLIMSMVSIGILINISSRLRNDGDTREKA
ncbi:MAG: putative lipid II flippase FtsW [Syntrophales bacterium]|jgi:cell division protein FtsW|nr:putative lipid II flippase FtsW [Syntrophales bacterium]MCK9528617.1 putative lipid II flippase FtsW [Syntrophales bacterium]MDX9923058.1 putative lipid II flippase FtsW [Syntrophales bacterium]